MADTPRAPQSTDDKRLIFPHDWPSPVYLTGEEGLRLSSVGNLAGLTLTLSGRILGLDNVVRPFVALHVPNSNRTIASTLELLSEGWLLGASVRVTGGSPSYGAVWAALELVRGSTGALTTVQALANDFVSAAAPLIWPGGADLDTLDAGGNLRSILGTTPGAGAEISEVVPTGARWQLLAFQSVLTTSAAVANRQPEFTLDDGANEFQRAPSLAAVVASSAVRVSWAPGMTNQISGTAASWMVSLGDEVILGAGYRLRTLTAAIQAADQWSQPRYLVREWFDV